jgi:hypothetical protein
MPCFEWQYRFHYSVCMLYASRCGTLWCAWVTHPYCHYFMHCRSSPGRRMFATNITPFSAAQLRQSMTSVAHARGKQQLPAYDTVALCCLHIVIQGPGNEAITSAGIWPFLPTGVVCVRVQVRVWTLVVRSTFTGNNTVLAPGTSH